MKKYIDDMLKKEYIRFNTSKYVAFVLIIKKSNDGFCVCVNYRVFNVFIIKNRNTLSLIKNTLTRLCSVKYYNKLNIIIAFNEIRMRQNDEKKTTFFIKYELFEYIVMFFDLCNAFEIFQSFINVILHEYLNDFCINYMNDILIYSKTKKKHIVHVLKVF